VKRFAKVVVAALIVSCLAGNGKFIAIDEPFPQPKPPANGAVSDRDPLREQVGQMTLEEKVGQMVVVGFEGTAVNREIKNLIENNHVGGVILFKRNITDATQLLDLLNGLKATNSVNKIPLFLSVDEEGGRVSRMPGELVKLPTNQVIGQADSEVFSYLIGKYIAGELKAFGFNMDFAPVLDVNSNPQNPVIGDRAFGNNPQIVTRLGLQTLWGMQPVGVIPVVKHFPGHGDTSVDSHVALPSVNSDLDRLRRFELIPFREAIQNGADAVMVAHILLPKIDPDYPASLSKTIITDLLKNELKFTGLVVTDDMTMGAITENYSIDGAAVQAIAAGSDLVLVCHEYQKELAVIDAIKNAVSNGTIPESRIDESVYKILKLKQKYGLSDRAIGSVDVARINKRMNWLLTIGDFLLSS
jgi:beta-N-acetylhexosaminidase